jgi:hypothetical protein
MNNSNAVIRDAAFAGELDCVKYLLSIQPLLLNQLSLADAASADEVDCLEYLQQCGLPWTGEEPGEAESPKVLSYCLDHVQPTDWDHLVLMTMGRNAELEWLHVSYDHGYEEHGRRNRLRHPIAIGFDIDFHTWDMESLRLELKNSGAGPFHKLDIGDAAEKGEEILRFVHGLGAPLNAKAVKFAAACDNVGALQYALENGAPLEISSFEFAIRRSSLKCLECLHKHALKVGLPGGCIRPSEWPSSYRKHLPGVSLAVLRYVCEKMDVEWPLQWARNLSQCMPQTLAERATNPDPPDEPLPWATVLYLDRVFRRLQQPLPAPLGDLVKERRERAAALAGVFSKAGQLPRLPNELQEVIALKAHLIVV